MSDGAPEQTLGSDIGSSKRTVNKGTVLLCKINPRINRVWIVKNHTPHQKIASTEWIPFSQTEAFEPKYLQYYLQQNAFRDFLAQNASGVGGSLMRVKPATFADYPMPLAPLEEQKRIVEAIETQFTRLDQATAVLHCLQQNIQRYCAAVLKHACEGNLLPQNPTDESADQLLQRILHERRRQWEAEAWQKEIVRAQKKAAKAARQAAGKSTTMRDIPDAEWQALPAEAYTSYLPNNDNWKQKYQEPEAPNTADLPELPTGWIWATFDQILLDLKNGALWDLMGLTVYVGVRR